MRLFFRMLFWKSINIVERTIRKGTDYDLKSYGEQFEKVIDIVESAKERTYNKVNEELILMYHDMGERANYSVQTLEK